MNAHKKINGMLVGYVLGELSPGKAEQVKLHLATCQPCSSEVDRLRTVLVCAEDLREHLSDETAAAVARARLFGTISNEKTVNGHVGDEQRPAAIWRKTMNSKIAKVAAMAAAVVIMGTLIYHFTGSVDVSSRAFGQVLEQVKKAKSVYYRSTLAYANNPPFTTEQMMNEDGVHRTNFGFPQVSIFDFRRGISLQLMLGNKIAYRSLRTPRPEATVFNSLDWLASGYEKHARYVGPETIDGMQTYLYMEDDDKYVHTSIWVDPSTDLPVRVVRENFAVKDANYLPVRIIFLEGKDFGCKEDGVTFSSTLSGSYTPEHSKEVMTDFRWNVELDPSLFVTDIPADYAEKHEDKAPEPNESHLVATLELWSEMSGGVLPSDVKEIMKPKKIKPMLIKKFSNSQDPNKGYDEARIFMQHVLVSAAVFAEGKIVKGNWHSGGEAVSRGEGDKLLYWWKDEESKKCRAMYGDLSIRDYDGEANSTRRE